MKDAMARPQAEELQAQAGSLGLRLVSFPAAAPVVVAPAVCRVVACRVVVLPMPVLRSGLRRLPSAWRRMAGRLQPL